MPVIATRVLALKGSSGLYSSPHVPKVSTRSRPAREEECAVVTRQRGTDLGHLGLELRLGQVGLARVHHLEDELFTAQQRVADKLPLPDGNRRVRHA